LSVIVPALMMLPPRVVFIVPLSNSLTLPAASVKVPPLVLMLPFQVASICSPAMAKL